MRSHFRLSIYKIALKSSYLSKLMLSILRITAEFLISFLAMKAFMAKKKVSRAERLRNFTYSLGAVLLVFIKDLPMMVLELFEAVRSL